MLGRGSLCVLGRGFRGFGRWCRGCRGCRRSSDRLRSSSTRGGCGGVLGRALLRHALGGDLPPGAPLSGPKLGQSAEIIWGVRSRATWNTHRESGPVSCHFQAYVIQSVPCSLSNGARNATSFLPHSRLAGSPGKSRIDKGSRVLITVISRGTVWEIASKCVANSLNIFKILWITIRKEKNRDESHPYIEKKEWTSMSSRTMPGWSTRGPCPLFLI